MTLEMFEIDAMIRRILVPVDGSPGSQRAVAMAKHLAEMERPRAEVILLHAIVPIPYTHAIPGGLSYLLRTIPDLPARRKKEAETILDEMSAFFVDSAVKPRLLIREGHPADEILKCIDSEKPSLLVMGSRGLSKANEFFLGSTSDAVVHYATCPVLIVR
ncbi:MAG: universal stress protein [Coprothermobacterota bacterium]|nr:universal stress protein [Coprothermobacterota bacterium]